MSIIGILGGSGFYAIDGLADAEELQVGTPFGDPSDVLMRGRLEGVEVVFLARHGRGHVLLPSEVNYRANIYALKKLGVERILSVSAVGSLRQELAVRDMVAVDQFVDRTKRLQPVSFFGNGIVAHVNFAQPVCGQLQKVVYDAASAVLAQQPVNPAVNRPPQAHFGGTYVNMEGPAFSTRAESLLYKSWGMDVIGMTNMNEARLAREAEMCYCTLAMITDYDCWHPEHESVNIEMIVANLNANAGAAAAIVRQALPALAGSTGCKCQGSLASAIVTPLHLVPAETRANLSLLLDKYAPGRS